MSYPSAVAIHRGFLGQVNRHAPAICYLLSPACHDRSDRDRTGVLDVLLVLRGALEPAGRRGVRWPGLPGSLPAWRGCSGWPRFPTDQGLPRNTTVQRGDRLAAVLDSTRRALSHTLGEGAHSYLERQNSPICMSTPNRWASVLASAMPVEYATGSPAVSTTEAAVYRVIWNLN